MRDSGHSAPDAVAEDAAEHARTRRGAGDLLDFGLAVDGVEPHPEREGARDVALFLDRVAEADAVGRRAGGERLLDLGRARAIEAGAEIGEQVEDLRRRVGLDGVEHPRIRQRLGEMRVVFAHDVEVDDEARAVFGIAEHELLDAIGHSGIPHATGSRENHEKGAGDALCPRAMETREASR